jgi:MFS family permease
MNWLLGRYGFRTTLRIWALGLFLLTVPLLKFMKPRLPPQNSNGWTVFRQNWRKLFNFSFAFTTHFAIMQACNIIEALGYFLPSIYLPSYAKNTLESSSLAAACTVIALNLASVFGCVCMGSFIDRYHVTTCIGISTVGTTLGVFLFWGLATNLPILYVFAISYGFFAGSFSSTWTGIIRDVKKKSDTADSGMVFAFLAFGRGVGNVVSGPLSETLMKGKPWVGTASMGYGTEYRGLIVFTGISALLGGGSFLWHRLEHR